MNTFDRFCLQNMSNIFNVLLLKGYVLMQEQLCLAVFSDHVYVVLLWDIFLNKMCFLLYLYHIQQIQIKDNNNRKKERKFQNIYYNYTIDTCDMWYKFNFI